MKRPKKVDKKMSALTQMCAEFGTHRPPKVFSDDDDYSE